MARRTKDIFSLSDRKTEKNKRDYARRKATKEQIPDIIIACEDELSVPTYLRNIVSELIKNRSITQDSFVIATHKHSNPIGVLTDLKNHTCSNGKNYRDFNHKWIVIDRDSASTNSGGHTEVDFSNTLKESKKVHVEVAYSNDAFELWILLHFIYIETFTSRKDLINKCISHLKAKNSAKFTNLSPTNFKDKKNLELIFKEILPLQPNAIKNSHKLLEFYDNEYNPAKDNPSTTMHLLIDLLNNLYRG